VGIDETGQDQATAGIEDVGPAVDVPPDLPFGAHGDDPSPGHRDRFGPRMGFVDGPDVGVDDSEFGPLGLG